MGNLAWLPAGSFWKTEFEGVQGKDFKLQTSSFDFYRLSLRDFFSLNFELRNSHSHVTKIIFHFMIPLLIPACTPKSPISPILFVLSSLVVFGVKFVGRISVPANRLSRVSIPNPMVHSQNNRNNVTVTVSIPAHLPVTASGESLSSSYMILLIFFCLTLFLVLSVLLLLFITV